MLATRRHVFFSVSHLVNNTFFKARLIAMKAPEPKSIDPELEM